MLKDGSLQMNILAFNNRFSYRNIFQNGVKTLSKIVLKLFYTQTRIKINIVERDFRLLIYAFARKRLTPNVLQKFIF